MKSRIQWFERTFAFGLPPGMLPFYLTRLEGSVLRLHFITKDLPDEVLSLKQDGKWSIKQNIGHLAEVDEVSNKRIDEMKSGTAILSPAVFEPKDYNPWPISQVLDYFTKVRTKNILKYQELTEPDLLKSSMHPRLKVSLTPVGGSCLV